jgi:hypothetical protein
VITGQSNEHGLKTLVAKATAGEVIYLGAMVDRIAEVLLQQGDTDPAGARRSKALGILGHPARALALLRSAGGDLVSTGSTTEGDAPLPAATLYVHVSRESMQTGGGVARMEGIGPITIGQASEFLRHSHVSVKPVIDLDEDRPVDCYEVPDRLRDQMHLRSPASAFPYSSATGRRMDLDHTIPFRVSTGSTPDGGQTWVGNLGKLTRFEHRVKTHGRGWRHRQPEPGVHIWRTPTGYQFTVDHTGTRVSTGSLRDASSLGSSGQATTDRTAYERAFSGILARAR